MSIKDLLFGDKKYFIPIIVKNRDFLIGYISGIRLMEDIVSKSMEVSWSISTVPLDSSRFNGLMKDGKNVEEMTDKQVKEYVENAASDIVERCSNSHPDNLIKENSFLNVECSCGLGFYNFKTHLEIPYNGLICSNCGRLVIYYSNLEDEEILNEKQN